MLRATAAALAVLCRVRFAGCVVSFGTNRKTHYATGHSARSLLVCRDLAMRALIWLTDRNRSDVPNIESPLQALDTRPQESLLGRHVPSLPPLYEKAAPFHAAGAALM